MAGRTIAIMMMINGLEGHFALPIINRALKGSKLLTANKSKTSNITGKLDKDYFESVYGKENVHQGGGNYKETKDNINNNHAANQQANKSSNFDEHVVNEKGLGNAGKGTGGVSTQTGTVVYSPNVSQQKQMRHIQGTVLANKSYLNSLDDAQNVLDAYNSGNHRLISENAKQSTVVIEVKGITGRYINTGNPNGLPDVNKPTNIFMIQSSGSRKILPVNPNKGRQ